MARSYQQTDRQCQRLWHGADITTMSWLTPTTTTWDGHEQMKLEEANSSTRRHSHQDHISNRGNGHVGQDLITCSSPFHSKDNGFYLYVHSLAFSRPPLFLFSTLPSPSFSAILYIEPLSQHRYIRARDRATSGWPDLLRPTLSKTRQSSDPRKMRKCLRYLFLVWRLKRN